MSEYDHILRQALALDPTIIPAIKTKTEIQQSESCIHRHHQVAPEIVMFDYAKPGVIKHHIEVMQDEFLDIQVMGGK